MLPSKLSNSQLTSHTCNSVEMYFRASALLFPICALASLAAAVPGAIDARGGSGVCYGDYLCCQTIYPANEVSAQEIQNLYSVIINPIIGPYFATECAGFTGNCNANVLCCTNSIERGLVYDGCSKYVE